MIDPDKFFNPPKGMMTPCTPHQVDLRDLLRGNNVMATRRLPNDAVVTTGVDAFQNNFLVRILPDGTVICPEGVMVTITHTVPSRQEIKRQTKDAKKRPGQNYLNLRKERW